MAILLDGRALADRIKSQLAQAIAGGTVRPGLGIVLVGDDPASQLYVRLKERAAGEVGMHFVKHLLPGSATTDEVIARVHSLNDDATIHGIVVQLPLPEGLPTDKIVSAIDPAKDVDGFHPENVRRLIAGEPVLVPSLVQSIRHLLEASGVPLSGKTAAVLARGSVLSKPLLTVLARSGVNATSDPASADILIAAVGQPQAVGADQIKPGAIVIDVGINHVGDRIVGDVDPAAAAHASFITPVPGGVGPVTVATLLENTYAAATGRNEHPS